MEESQLSATSVLFFIQNNLFYVSIISLLIKVEHKFYNFRHCCKLLFSNPISSELEGVI